MMLPSTVASCLPSFQKQSLAHTVYRVYGVNAMWFKRVELWHSYDQNVADVLEKSIAYGIR